MLKYHVEDVSAHELKRQAVETLPDSAETPPADANFAIRVNLALAANVSADGAIAAATTTRRLRSTQT